MVKTATTRTDVAVVTEDELRPNDVLLGRGKTFHFRQGNVDYRRAVKVRSREYRLRHSQERDMVAVEIIKSIREKGGRFLHLKKDGSGSHCWVECPDPMVWTKVKQALRDSGKSSQSPSFPCQDDSAESKRPDPQVCSLRRDEARTCIPQSSTVTSPTVVPPKEECTIGDIPLLGRPYLDQSLVRNVPGIDLSPVAAASLSGRWKPSTNAAAALQPNPLLFALMHRRPTVLHPTLLSSLLPVKPTAPTVHSQRYLELLRNHLQPEHPMMNSEVVEVLRRLQGSS